MKAPIPTQIVPSAVPSDQTPRQVLREFRARLEGGMRILPAGTAKRDPESLLRQGYVPRYRVDLFDATFYLAEVRQNDDIRFFVAYVIPGTPGRGGRDAYPRILYKDISLVWRSASHFVRSDAENWIGKGDLAPAIVDGEELMCSAEETTDLPLEIQTALEDLCRRPDRIRKDTIAIERVLRRGPDDRLAPYRDFTEPRRRAQSDSRNLINRNRPIARFTRENDPTSLRFVRGFEPDFDAGILEIGGLASKMYGGHVGRYRILSSNRKIQYLFFAGSRQVWIIPPQATTTELMSFGVRTIDVHVDDDLCVPAFEYHYLDDSVDPPEWVSQIPKGYVGDVCEADPSRSDASPWLDELPVIREFRMKVLGRRPRRRSADQSS